jgi:simple sugar transport system ATP-binding protein
VNTQETTPRELTELMVGRSVSLEIRRVDPRPAEKPALQVQGLTLSGPDGRRFLDTMSFEVSGGEILGVAGIAGSGQRELCEIIAGIRRADSGSIRFLGEEILGLDPRTILKKGVSMSYIPEDRLGMGLAAGLSVWKNMMLRSYANNDGPLVNHAAGKADAERIVERYDISTPSVNHAVKDLSGGNIQKVLLGRELDIEPKLLVTAYPVRGLDVGASKNVYDMLNEQKSGGVAVLFIGEDLDVLCQLCDRIMVIHAGRVMGTLDARRATKEDIGLLMLGG